MVGRTFSYRSRSISRGPITISNASLIESDVMLVLNKESFRTLQFIRLPRDLGGDRNYVSAFRVYSAVCLYLWCLWKYWLDEGRKNFKIETQYN
jgi:rieske iron-sulfur protein